jgi:hypothetical protein
VKVGDLVRFKKNMFTDADGIRPVRTWIVRRMEPKSSWTFLFGMNQPIQTSLLEILSKRRC